MTMHTDLQSFNPHEPNLPKSRRFRRLAVAAVVALLSLGALLITIRTVLSAADIEYFNAISTSNMVLLEWSTRSEYNVARFDVLCKLASEPDAAFHVIGSRPSKGSPTQGALYDFPVTQLEPGVAYCFQLHEITTDDEPGERRNLCGYGLNITPESNPFFTTLTPGLFSTATITAGFTGVATPFTPQFPQQPTSPLGTPTPLGAAPVQPPAVVEVSTATATPPSVDVAQTGAGDDVIDSASNASGLAVPAPLPSTETPSAELPLAVVTTVNTDDSLTIPITETPTSAPVTTTMPLASARIDGAAAVAAAPVGEPTATPTSLYVVVTAAPTLAPAALPALLTPWPTATPIPGAQVASIFVPTAQNLTVMLLCFIFFSATGLGALGLITSVLYMRSRSQREMLEMQRRSRLR